MVITYNISGDYMNLKETINLISGKKYIIDDYIIKNYRLLDIDSDELILIIYFINNPNIEFDVNDISIALNIDIMLLMKLINSLITKRIIDIVVGRENNIINREYISLDLFYNKLVLLITKKEEVNTNIYSIFEREFGRLITPTEYEIIGSWLENGFEEEVILAALKEAIYNGVRNLKYIDKILYAWRNKGIKTKEDISKLNVKEETEKPVELYDYEWFK